MCGSLRLLVDVGNYAAPYINIALLNLSRSQKDSLLCGEMKIVNYGTII